MLTHNTPLPLPVCSSASSVARSMDVQHCVWPSPVATNHQVPRAPLPADGVTVRGKASCALSGGVTPLSSLVWTHATDQIPPSDFVGHFGRSWQVAVSPCWKMALPDVISAVCVKTLGPLPRRVPTILPILVPFLTGWYTSIARHRPRLRVDKHGTPRKSLPLQLPQGGVFRGCSHSLMFRLLHLLGPQVAPTAVLGTGQPGRLHHAMSLPLPPEAVISLRTRNGKTDTAGLAPARLRPCRPLPDSRPLPAGVHA